MLDIHHKAMLLQPNCGLELRGMGTAAHCTEGHLVGNPI